ncbi:hypothetical protein [Asanoa sp. NPDC050611]|uniref:Cap15 family cyclic dinucleotide receptor domain-containing protein n=1 Tax=Asanoa sp. NPDC050611 TaxID=3157098 RepID=UPI0033C5C23D
MHPYSTDSTRSVRVMFFLAVAAVLFAYLLDRALSTADLEPPWWLDTPAVLGFYGLLWRLYDRHLWRLSRHGRTLSGIPDYGGEWEGEIITDHESGVVLPATLTIHQTSSRILVTLRTDDSGSDSSMAALSTRPGQNQGLRYEYVNTPTPMRRSWEIHKGLSQLVLSPDGRSLDGYYQNFHGRHTSGKLTFRRRQPAGRPEAVPS